MEDELARTPLVPREEWGSQVVYVTEKKSMQALGLAGSSVMRTQEEQVVQGDGEFRLVPFRFSKEASQDFLLFPALLSFGLHS